MVLIWHYLGCEANNLPWMKQVVSLAWSGVELFFVLSGFLIGGILLDHAGSAGLYKVFYLRRALRILPVYLLLLGGFSMLASRCQQIAAFSWLFGHPIPIWTYLLFVQNFFMARQANFGPNPLSVTWSLAIEEQFYLVLPLLMILSPRRVLAPILLSWTIALPIIRACLCILGAKGLLVHGFSKAYFIMPFRLDSFFLGVLGAMLLRNARLFSQLCHSLAYLRALSMVLLLGLMGFIWSGHTGGQDFWMLSLGHTWLSLLYLLILLHCVVARKGMILSIFRWRWLRFLGTISYGVYLFHQIVSGVLHGLIRHSEPSLLDFAGTAVTILSVITTLALASLSWIWLEKPLLRWGHNFKFGEPVA